MRRPLPVALVIFVMLLWQNLHAQTVYFNTTTSLHQMFGPPGSCAFTDAGYYCNQEFSERIFSIALHKDTLYMVGENNTIYSFKPGVPGSCKRVKFFAINTPDGSSALNSLTADKNGVLYAVDHNSTELYRYNPYTDEEAILGRINQPAGGDLIFYKDKLLLSTLNNRIYEINLSDPAASTVYMNTGAFAFTGLLSIPDGCEQNRYYGLSPNGSNTDLVELDLENKVVLGVSCQVPYVVRDAGSITDNGTVSGVSFTSLKIQPPCLNSTTGSITVQAFTPAAGLTYWLDNTISNTTGIFTDVPEGPHVVSIRNGLGCTKDSAINIFHGLSNIVINTFNPIGCAPPPTIPCNGGNPSDGKITVSATSGYGPVVYVMNDYWVRPDGIFEYLVGGYWRLSVRDAGGCRFDTTIHLPYLNRPEFMETVDGTPTGCDSKTGKITAKIKPGYDPANFSITVNGITHPGLDVTGLDAGTYTVSVTYRICFYTCKFDTIIVIRKFIDDEPSVDIAVKDQSCLNSNGQVSLTITGPATPFLVDFNNLGFSSNFVYNNLAPGIYPIKIASRNYCIWERTAEIRIIPSNPGSTSIVKGDASCDQPSKVRVTTTGPEGPYSFEIAGIRHNSGDVVTGLGSGTHLISIFNKDDCKVDTTRTTINLFAGCEDVYVPKAFTPNGDGLNDVFRPVFNPALENIHFRVFNRYGQPVFESRGNNVNWRGTYQGQKQPAGVYVWSFTYIKNGFPFSEKGTVLLIR